MAARPAGRGGDLDGPTLPFGYGLGIGAFGGYLGHNGSVQSHEAIMAYDPVTGTLVIEVHTTIV